jgi:thioesterase domain-containing protein
MARQLRTTNRKILGVILIDSPCPMDHVPLPAPIIEHICRGQLRGLREPFSIHAAMLGRYTPTMLGDDPAVVLLRNREAFDSRALCGVDYPFLSERGQSRSEVTGWEELTGQSIEVLDIPGNHFETFGKEHVSNILSSLLCVNRLAPLLMLMLIWR